MEGFKVNACESRGPNSVPRSDFPISLWPLAIAIENRGGLASSLPIFPGQKSLLAQSQPALAYFTTGL